MTWEELIEKARELGYTIETDEKSIFGIIYDDDIIITFAENGWIWLNDGYEPSNCIRITNRTYDQMYQIMLALKN